MILDPCIPLPKRRRGSRGVRGKKEEKKENEKEEKKEEEEKFLRTDTQTHTPIEGVQEVLSDLIS